MGPRTIQHEMAANESPAAAPAPVSGADACNIHSKAFQDCVNNFGSDISKCQFYMDMLAECKRELWPNDERLTSPCQSSLR
ncbi:hypothetical protein QQ045_028774 [Rhodiola kirilowii]